MTRLAVGTAATLLALAGLAVPVASEARVLQQALGGSDATENYNAGNQQLQLVSLAAYPNAVCNDGSPAAFYYSAGSDPNNWVVYLEGGFWCLGQDSCWGRQTKEPAQVSSVGWSQTTEAGGVFSRDATQNPVWATANFAYVRYCSSDAWMGDASAFSMEFRGQAIVAATFAALQANHGLGSGARLLFGGCSAGARGAMVLLDSVAAQMAAVGVEVRGMLDSNLWLDIQPTSSAALGGSLLEQAQDVYGFANVGAVIPADCAAAYEQEPWKCIFGEYRMPFLKTPYFLSQSMFDDFQVDYDCGSTTQTDMAGKVNTVVTTDEIACVDNFQNTMRSTLAQLPAPGQSAVGIFSSTCSLHCTSNGPDWWTIQVNGQSMASLMTAWFFASDTPSAVSACSGVECMQQCLPEEQQFPSGDFDATQQNR